MNPDDQQPGGNFYNKYASRHPIERKLVSNFVQTVISMALRTGVKEALEVGCGEGEFSRRLAAAGLRVRGTDASPEIIEHARAVTKSDNISFEAKSIDQLGPGDEAPLVACIEVLEHVTDPASALKKLASLARPYLLLSVPREPVWRLLNIASGRYIRRLGNTPGHLNHWTSSTFTQFVSTEIKVEERRTPLPWTVILGRVRHVLLLAWAFASVFLSPMTAAAAMPPETEPSTMPIGSAFYRHLAFDFGLDIRDLVKLERRGFGRGEVVTLVIIAKTTGTPVKEYAKRRLKDKVGLKELASEAGLDYPTLLKTVRAVKEGIESKGEENLPPAVYEPSPTPEPRRRRRGEPPAPSPSPSPSPGPWRPAPSPSASPPISDQP